MSVSVYPGCFLVSTPKVTQGFFINSVIFLYENHSTGSAGLVLNKQMNLSLQDIAQSRGRDYPPGHHSIFCGGPIAPRSVLLLHSDDFYSSNTRCIPERNLCVSSDETMLEKILSHNEPQYMRLFAGTSVWGPGQLETEILAGTWLICDIPNEIIFNAVGDAAWHSSLEQAGKIWVEKYFI